jgi:hypothetical protein
MMGWTYWDWTRCPGTKARCIWKSGFSTTGANTSFLKNLPAGVVYWKAGPMSFAWITFGFAKFFSCSRWSRKQTSAGKSTNLRSSQLWRNTLDLSDQVFYLDYLGYLANLLQSGYLVYLGLLMLLLGSLVGQTQLKRRPSLPVSGLC